MMPGNVFGRPAETEATEATDPAAGPVTGVLGEHDPADVDAGRRVDLGRVLTGLAAPVCGGRAGPGVHRPGRGVRAGAM